MRLVDLNPVWVGHGGPGITTMSGDPVPERERVGVIFDCPCGDSDEFHRLYIPIANPEDGQGPVGRGPHWTRSGDTFETLTLTPSIRRMDNCKWHGWVTDGGVTGRCER